MTPRRLRGILDGLDELAAVGLAGAAVKPAGPYDVLLADWRSASREANAAYAEWCRRRDRDSYSSYRACADRADAAQDALADRQSSSGAPVLGTKRR